MKYMLILRLFKFGPIDHFYENFILQMGLILKDGREYICVGDMKRDCGIIIKIKNVTYFIRWAKIEYVANFMENKNK